MGRRSRNIAKQEIYTVFRKFVRAGNTKATVSSIIEETGMNRKTFYNHFSCRDELVAWGFRRDLADVLMETKGDAELLEPASDPYNFEDLPCYFRVSTSALSLDQSQFFFSFREAFRRHKGYYQALLRTELAAPFCWYLVELLDGILYEDLQYFLSGRRMPEEAMRYITAFFAEGITHHVVDAFSGNLLPGASISDITPVNNLVHESMLHIVEAYQSEKASNYFNKTRSL